MYNNKGCWTQTNGIPYLNAYLCDYETPSEIMVQLAVLTPLKEYIEWSGEKNPLYDDLQSGIAAFYDPKIKTINRWLPALYDKLDQSEEQKKGNGNGFLVFAPSADEPYQTCVKRG